MPTERPKGETGSKVPNLPSKGQVLLNLVSEVLGDHEVEPGSLFDQPQITIAPQTIVGVCRSLKEDTRTRFSMLACIAAVDYKEYIQMVYILFSLDHHQSLALKVNLTDDEPTVPSVSSIWRGAEWYEREAHDLFGVYFEGHPDMSPLLLYEGFEGYPGRKEFPFHEYQEY